MDSNLEMDSGSPVIRLLFRYSDFSLESWPMESETLVTILYPSFMLTKDEIRSTLVGTSVNLLPINAKVKRRERFPKVSGRESN
jgi:hypothetical protein